MFKLHNDIIFSYSHRVSTESEKSVLTRQVYVFASLFPREPWEQGCVFACLQKTLPDHTYDVKCSFELLYRDLVKLEIPLSSKNHVRGGEEEYSLI